MNEPLWIELFYAVCEVAKEAWAALLAQLPWLAYALVALVALVAAFVVARAIKARTRRPSHEDREAPTRESSEPLGIDRGDNTRRSEKRRA